MGNNEKGDDIMALNSTTSRRFFDYAICLAIGLVMSLPTGYFIGIPTKIILLIAGVLLLLVKDKYVFLETVKFCLAIAIGLSLWLGIGFLNWGKLSIREFQMIFVPLLVSFIAYKESRSTFGICFLKSILVIFVIVSFVVKFLTCLFFYFNFYDFDGVLNGYIAVFGAQFVGLVINDHLVRVFLSSDMAVAMVPLFILMARDNFNKKWLFMMFSMSAFTVFIGYSRSVWGVYFLSCLVFFFLHFKKNGWMSIVAPVATILLLQLITTNAFYDCVHNIFHEMDSPSGVIKKSDVDFKSHEMVSVTSITDVEPSSELIANNSEHQDIAAENGGEIKKEVKVQDDNHGIFYQRFLKFNNESSDGIRAQQASALWGLFLQHPVLGVGLGGYDVNLIRSATEPYSYELQLFSLLPKLGIVGSLILAGFIVWCFIVLGRDQRYIGMLVLAMFLAAGMLNPYLFSSSASLVYLFMMREVVMAYKREPKNA